MLKKSLSLILALIMCLSVAVVIPVTTSARSVEIAETSAAKLATPKITKLTGTASGVKITIAKVNGAAKYAYFFLSNHKWKKIGVTTATSFVHKGVKSGKRYIYTVRCVASNGKTFTSAYNKKGWVITYKKPKKENWSNLYKSYVLNKKYLKADGGWGDNLSVNRGYDELYLYDLDHNGIPELFVDFGYLGGGHPHNIYTIKKGKVTLLERTSFGGPAVIYNPTSKYKGLFSNGGRMGAYYVTYHYMKSGKLQSEKVVLDTYKENDSRKFNTSIYNKALYNAYLACTKARKDPLSPSLREAKKPLPTYSYKQIKSMGWNKFIKKYGY